MTDPGKWYWLRKRGTQNQPGQKHGLLAGRNARRKAVWTQKPAIASVFAGGTKLDEYLTANPDHEAVEVRQLGHKTYHGRTVEHWEPVG